MRPDNRGDIFAYHSGATQTEDRKREIYAICQLWNIIIIEDDPYYYLQYAVGEPPRGLKNLGASYLSMDTDARVCRLDTFSKVRDVGEWDTKEAFA